MKPLQRAHSVRRLRVFQMVCVRNKKRIAGNGCVVAFLTGATASPALSATHDAQTWLTGTAEFQIDQSWSLDVEISGRFTDFADRLGESQYRAVLTRQLSPAISASAGAGAMITHHVGVANRTENRFWQAVVWSPGSIADISIATRTQLEQRLIDDGFGWRARQRISFKRPVSKRVHLFASSEAYFALKDTAYGARSGFEQLRLGAGVGYRLSENILFKASYLNRWKAGQGVEDEMSHIFGFAVVVRP